MSEILSETVVRRIAQLARLKLNDDQIGVYRDQLRGVLAHIDTLNELDVSQVEPLAHPLGITNHLDEDIVGPALPVDTLLKLAPATEDRRIVVPKVIESGD